MLSVYDLDAPSGSFHMLNNLLLGGGFGAFHSGVVVYGVEYTYTAQKGIIASFGLFSLV